MSGVFERDRSVSDESVPPVLSGIQEEEHVQDSLLNSTLDVSAPVLEKERYATSVNVHGHLSRSSPLHGSRIVAAGSASIPSVAVKIFGVDDGKTKENKKRSRPLGSNYSQGFEDEERDTDTVKKPRRPSVRAPTNEGFGDEERGTVKKPRRPSVRAPTNEGFGDEERGTVKKPRRPSVRAPTNEGFGDEVGQTEHSRRTHPWETNYTPGT